MTESWIRADWQADDRVVAGCTTRTGGISSGRYASLNLGAHVGDDSVSVTENRRRMIDRCALPAEPVWLEQVHGTTVLVEPGRGEQADAAVTRQPGVVCTVMVADCLPVLLTASDGTEVGAVHAGWRGLAAGVIEKTIDVFAAEPADVLAWLGPAISQDAFEVGSEVRQAFVDHDARASAAFDENERGRWQADLYGLARQRLGDAGVTEISGGGFCTYGDPGRFFSYRRDGQCGRMAAFVFRGR